MRESEFELGLSVEICNHGDFAMTHKKYIGTVGTIEKRTKGGLAMVKVTPKHSIACPLRVLKVVTVESIA